MTDRWKTFVLVAEFPLPDALAPFVTTLRKTLDSRRPELPTLPVAVVTAQDAAGAASQLGGTSDGEYRALQYNGTWPSNARRHSFAPGADTPVRLALALEPERHAAGALPAAIHNFTQLCHERGAGEKLRFYLVESICLPEPLHGDGGTA